jgi:hypothetical protein
MRKCYKSRFGADDLITAAQYIAENMCSRMAVKQKTELGVKFWKTEAWERKFLLQLRSANALLKLYDPEAIIRALRTAAGKKVYSLAAEWLDPIIQGEQRKLNQEKAVAEARAKADPKPSIEPTQPKPTEAPRPAFVEKKNQLSKLRDL